MPEEKPDYGVSAGKTAIARRSVSVPTRELIAAGRITKLSSVLNHGRGRADNDATALSQLASSYAEYDPNYSPDREVLNQRYDVVVSNYVMNVLPPDVRKLAWEDIAQATGGVAYITVRSSGDKAIRGKKYKDGVITSIGTFQKGYTATGLTREAKKYFNKVEVIMGRSAGISWTIAASESKIAGPGEVENPQKQVENAFEEELADIQRRAGITTG
jgi:hypothetical protein